MKHHVICLFQEPEKAEIAEPAKEEPKAEAKAKNRSNRGGKGAMGKCRGSSMLSLRGSVHHKICEDISADVVDEETNRRQLWSSWQDLNTFN